MRIFLGGISAILFLLGVSLKADWVCRIKKIEMGLLKEWGTLKKLEISLLVYSLVLGAILLVLFPIAAGFVVGDSL